MIVEVRGWGKKKKRESQTKFRYSGNLVSSKFSFFFTLVGEFISYTAIYPCIKLAIISTRLNFNTLS